MNLFINRSIGRFFAFLVALSLTLCLLSFHPKTTALAITDSQTVTASFDSIDALNTMYLEENQDISADNIAASEDNSMQIVAEPNCNVRFSKRSSIFMGGEIIYVNGIFLYASYIANQKTFSIKLNERFSDVNVKITVLKTDNSTLLGATTNGQPPSEFKFKDFDNAETYTYVYDAVYATHSWKFEDASLTEISFFRNSSIYISNITVTATKLKLSTKDTLEILPNFKTNERTYSHIGYLNTDNKHFNIGQTAEKGVYRAIYASFTPVGASIQFKDETTSAISFRFKLHIYNNVKPEELFNGQNCKLKIYAEMCASGKTPKIAQFNSFILSDDALTFDIALYNIPSEHFSTDITVKALVNDPENPNLQSSNLTRSIAFVAQETLNDLKDIADETYKYEIDGKYSQFPTEKRELLKIYTGAN